MFIFSALGRLVAACVATCLTIFAIAATASAAVVPEYGDTAPTGTIPAAASHGSGTNVGLIVGVAILAAALGALVAIAANHRHRRPLVSVTS
jgi:hypothetical protein